MARNLGSFSLVTACGGAVTLAEDLHVGSGGPGTFTLNTVPEPGTRALLAFAGLAAALALHRRRN